MASRIKESLVSAFHHKESAPQPLQSMVLLIRINSPYNAKRGTSQPQLECMDLASYMMAGSKRMKNCVFSGHFLWNPRTSKFGQQGPKLQDGWKTE